MYLNNVRTSNRLKGAEFMKDLIWNALRDDRKGMEMQEISLCLQSEHTSLYEKVDGSWKSKVCLSLIVCLELCLSTSLVY